MSTIATTPCTSCKHYQAGLCLHELSPRHHFTGQPVLRAERVEEVAA